MVTEIKIPDMGTTVEEVTIVKWRKGKGDFIKVGEIIAEIETDKAVVELESVAEGKILETLYEEGNTVKQGSVIAYVGKEGETIEEKVSLKISPALKNLAAKLGVDISRIKASHPDGVITRNDILNAAKTEKRRIFLPEKKYQEIPFHQRTVIKKVVKSHLEIPPVHFVASIDMEKVMDFRNKMVEKNKTRISYDAFFIFSCARCIKKIPVMSSYLSGEKIEKRQEISIALAVAYRDKLFTPVIRSADTKTLMDISNIIGTVVKKIEQGTISPEEMEGACFLVSNLGMYPVEQFTAIIYPGHSGALAIGKISKKFIVENDEPVVRNMCNITLSCDHRIINGSTAGLFLKEVKEFLENGLFMEEG